KKCVKGAFDGAADLPWKHLPGGPRRPPGQPVRPETGLPGAEAGPGRRADGAGRAGRRAQGHTPRGDGQHRPGRRGGTGGGGGEGEERAVAGTMGQQQWLTPSMATFAAAMGLVGLLVTPWALFALLWPLSDVVGSTTLPGDLWNTIDTYMASQGAVFGGAQE